MPVWFMVSGHLPSRISAPRTAAPPPGEQPPRTVATIVVPYEVYELYDWGKVTELYGTL